MKTTFDLPEQLVRDVQRVAKARGTTARSLVEQSLRDLLEAAQHADRFELPDASVGGKGLRPEFDGASWADLRDAAYGMPS